MTVDYKQLLIKYMAHVGDEEGAVFVPTFGSKFVFTKDELAFLEEINAAQEKGELPQKAPNGNWMSSADFPDI